MEAQSEKKSGPSTKSNRELNASKAELLDQLLAQCSDGEDFFGPEGVFTKLKGAVMERLLQAELTEHLEQPSREPEGPPRNARNGYSPKTVQTETGPVRISVPRDRNGTFEPQVVKKHQRRVEGFDEKVLALYARGMTTRDIQGHLQELYGTEVSAELISKATDSIMPLFREWQARPLDAVYPIVYLDALFVPVRDGVQVQKRAFYVALGVQLDGKRDVLGIWAAEAEGAKFWLSILNELRGRGVEDVLFVCADGLSGLDKALEAAFPRAIFQTCVVHMIRAALRFVSWSDRKELAAALKPLYTAENEERAKAELDALEAKYGTKYPSVTRTFRNRWSQFAPFLAYPQELRRILYTTNAVESLNSQLRKALGKRGPFPNDEAVFKLFFLAIRNAKLHWKADPHWFRTLAQLDIFFEGRLPA
jgi:putative transposase